MEINLLSTDRVRKKPADRWRRHCCALTGLLFVLLSPSLAFADMPSWLPRYDLNMRIEVAQHCVTVCERVTWTNHDVRPAVRGADNSSAGSDPVPVESNMHELMEYVFQPTCKRLKSVMTKAPTDKQGWKSIKSDALILAEGGNLLLLRKSEKKPAEWTGFSIAVREAGGQFYRATQQKDFSASRNAYEQMLTKCNSCHRQFAGGKHQLAL